MPDGLENKKIGVVGYMIAVGDKNLSITKEEAWQLFYDLSKFLNVVLVDEDQDDEKLN